ncbi:MAG: S46 family peptidase [Proteobacteria bacterium]|nr:S46 family peptidase [Pseudomonadota bacterium]
MRKLACLAVGLVLTAPLAFAGEGMWPLSNLPVATLQKQFGFTPSPEWIQHVQLASVRLAGGCSGSFVSPDGLVLTNHHCVVGCLEALSTSTRNLMGEFFYADAQDKELKCPDMDVQQLRERTNVTRQVETATAGKSGDAYSKARKAIESELQQHCVNGQSDKWTCQVVSLYHGGQFWLYKYRSYRDVRLVFAPSQQTAYFGGYPDNFDFPRYDYDVSIVRVFVDGKPARTPEYFHMSTQGPKAGELVFTSGNPGSTARDDTIAQLDAIKYPGYPSALMSLSRYQGLLEAFGGESPENARIAQGTLFFVGNAIKSLTGQLAALHDPAPFARKQQQENALRAKVDADPALKKQYGDAWENIAAAQQKLLSISQPYAMIVRQEGFQARLYDIAFTIVLGDYERTLPEAQRIARFRDASLPAVEQQLFSPAPVYPNYDKVRLVSSLTTLRDTMGVDAPISAALFAEASPRQVAENAVANTKLADVAVREQLWKGGEKAIKASGDPMIALAREVLPFYLKYHKLAVDDILATIQANTAKIARARFALYGTSIAPDATFTERVSYGTVEGWPRDGKQVPPFTYMDGLYQHAKGYPPLELTREWLDARSSLDPKTPVNFVSSNDIVGGNSGSPVINRDGVLVGLIFDGNPPSLGGTFWYDGETNRAVAVDSAFILAGLAHVYHAQALVKELIGG